MQNTLDNKIKFFAQYLNLPVFWHDEYDTEIMILEPILLQYKYLVDGYKLLLTPLSQISDEDAIECLKFFGLTKFDDLNDNDNKKQLFAIFSGADMDEIQSNEYHPTIYLQLYDYLRSKGYALPWMGLSVEQLVEYGWVKLKTK